MDILYINSNHVTPITELPTSLAPSSFFWLDATHDEVAQNPVAWRDTVEQLTGIHIYEPHLTDAINLAHPSYFDSTHHYALVVFRKLALSDNNNHQDTPLQSTVKRKIPPALSKLDTMPVTFVLMNHALVTIHAPNSRTIGATRNRLLEYGTTKQETGVSHGRLPASPEELMLRLLNAMVDQYLALRQPLASQIDRWQRALLSPRKPFNNWTALLEARIELRKLDHLCEGQHDAVQELRDYLVDNHHVTGGHHYPNDLLLVRINDVIEHITRALNHVRRLESSIESAVQIHFSAMAYRTSEIMRTLTVLTALFMPLTLITGIFGMNFVEMPLLKNKEGFWITVGIMALIVAILLFFFHRKRYLDDSPPHQE